MRSYRLLYLPLILSLAFSCAVFAENDSLQIHLYHGLDEIGVGSAFHLDCRQDSFYTRWSGYTNLLYRQLPGAADNLKSDGLLHGVIGRGLGRGFDVHTIFEGNRYQLQSFSSGQPYALPFAGPPRDYSLNASLGSLPIPPNQINRYFSGLGATYQPDSSLHLTAALGHRWDRREGFKDEGVSATLQADVVNFQTGGYRNDLSMSVEHEKLDQRLNREFKVQYALFKRFSPHSSDHLNLAYRYKRYDYHSWGSANLGTRLDGEQTLQNQLRYFWTPRVGLLVNTDLQGSHHEDRTATARYLRKELSTSTALRLEAARDKISGWLGLKFDWANQEDATGLKRERGTSLESAARWSLSSRDSLEIVSAVRKRQYDTLDPDNFDDRDRLRYEFGVINQHRFNPHFRLYQRADVVLEHLVYIYSAKSDQNNWNRILRVSPSIYSEPSRNVRNLTRFELAVNLTDYDFELDPTNLKSSIYRRYTAADSLTLQLSRRWDVTLEYSIDFEDGGRLIWENWVQQISDEYRAQHAAWRFRRLSNGHAYFEMGLAYFQRQGWEYDLSSAGESEKTPILYVSRWGPFLKLNYPASNRLDLDVHWDFSLVHEWSRADYTIVNLDLRLTWK